MKLFFMQSILFSSVRLWILGGVVFTILVWHRPVFSDENHDPRPPIEIETLGFYDWEVASSSKEEDKRSCHIQFTGVSRQRILITLRLSMVKESPSSSAANAITIIKISADQIRNVDLSDARAIPLSNAWLETSTVTTLGELEKIEVAEKTYFLGASKGSGLFIQALRGIRKEGVVIGYRTQGNPFPKVFKAESPPPEIFEQLQSCLSQNASWNASLSK